MKNLIRLIRPHQWVKNLVVLLPVFFGGALLHIESVYAGLVTALCFSFAASSIYCLNDIVDVEDDRQSPYGFRCNQHHTRLYTYVFDVRFVDAFDLFVTPKPTRDSMCNPILLVIKHSLLPKVKAVCNY